jgi:hypothetical protein
VFLEMMQEVAERPELMKLVEEASAIARNSF